MRKFLVMAVLVVVGLAVSGWMRDSAAQEKKEAGAFSTEVIDLGICVTDIEKSAAFYKAIGFTELDGFSVPADFATQAGLTENKPLSIRVFVLGKGEKATKIKLMQVAGTTPKKSDNGSIHSQTGFRYLTIMVTDMTSAMEKLKAAKAEVLGKAPHPLPKGLPEGVFLTVFKDPDGNLIEFVGPKK